MPTCTECRFFFRLSENEGDFEPGKGDCVTEHRDEKGKFWLSKPTYEQSETCKSFTKGK